jgi:putative ABC transport system ATP-binding protein
MEDAKTLVVMQNISKIYKSPNLREVRAIDGVSFEIRSGEFVLVMGPSGSGKSTLLYIMGCLENPTEGDYLLNGVSVTSCGDRTLSEIRGTRIGFVFQDFNLFPHLSALYNVAFPLIYKDLAKAERIREARRWLAEVGMEDRSHHLPSQLSGGEQQRIAIARALVSDPLLIIADEPTGNLDQARGDEIFQTFKELNRKGRTIVVATHNPAYMKYADRVLRLQDGKILSDTDSR